MSTGSQTAQDAAPVRALGDMAGVGKTIVYALLIALVIRIALFQPFTIPTGSMEPTVRPGDYIIVSKFSYGFSRYSMPGHLPFGDGRFLARQPKRGDIIVFKLPRDLREDYVKRLIGLPGDHVQVRRGVLYINDKPAPQQPLGETFTDLGGFPTRADVYRETLPGGRTHISYSVDPTAPPENTEVYVVPEDHYFFMGDNRDNSLDSRFPPQSDGVGFVPFENLEGKAQIVLLSWNKGASLFKPWTWVSDLRPSRFFHYLY
jgi:signal peptidase I